jgi:hypothetical protein
MIWFCKTTEIFICEKILTISGKKITSKLYINSDTLLHVSAV